jgi:DNA topoisomerase VI subunit B
MMKSISYKDAVEKKDSFLTFVGIAYGREKLEANEYYALMVTDDNYPRNKNPYVIGVEPSTHEALIGVERTDNRPYISKKYENRRTSYRGTAIIVEVQPEDVKKCCLLTY